MADEVKVITQDLRTKAVEIENIQFSGLMSKPLVIPPDQLTLSKTAVDNLNQNASFLYRNQDYGDREGDRLAETLQSVAEAYDLADASAAANIDGIGAPQTPKLNTIPAPTIPAPMGSPLGLTADEIGDVEVAQQQLSAGDHGASLREAAAQWMANGNALEASSQQFKVKIENWEGDAADQAYAKFVSYGEWLSQLGESWQKLAAEAMRISDAHVKALLNHTPVYQNYEQLKSQMIAAIANGGSAAHTLGLEMEELQRQSEEIIEGYSKEAAPQRVTPPTPPPSGVPAVPVTGNGKPRKSGPGSDFQTPPGSGTGGGGGGGGGQPPSMSPPTASPLGADPAGGGAPQTGSPRRALAPVLAGANRLAVERRPAEHRAAVCPACPVADRRTCLRCSTIPACTLRRLTQAVAPGAVRAVAPGAEAPDRSRCSPTLVVCQWRRARRQAARVAGPLGQVDRAARWAAAWVAEWVARMVVRPRAARRSAGRRGSRQMSTSTSKTATTPKRSSGTASAEPFRIRRIRNDRGHAPAGGLGAEASAASAVVDGRSAREDGR